MGELMVMNREDASGAAGGPRPFHGCVVVVVVVAKPAPVQTVLASEASRPAMNAVRSSSCPGVPRSSPKAPGISSTRVEDPSVAHKIVDHPRRASRSQMAAPLPAAVLEAREAVDVGACARAVGLRRAPRSGRRFGPSHISSLNEAVEAGTGPTRASPQMQPPTSEHVLPV